MGYLVLVSIFLLSQKMAGKLLLRLFGILGLELHVYTTVDEDKVSGMADAIRFVLYDRNSEVLLDWHKGCCVLGLDTFSTVQIRLRELVAIARAMKAAKQFCQNADHT